MQNGQNGQMSVNDLLNLMVTHPSIYGGQTGSLIASLQPAMQKQALLQSQLGGLQSSFDNAGGAQGLAGIGNELESLVPGTAANAYNSRKTATAAALADILGIKNPQDVAGLLPGLMQNSQTANNNMSVLGSMSNHLGAI